MPIHRWRAPVALQVKFAASAALVTAVCLRFFPLWAAVPVAAAGGAWALGMCIRGAAVIVDPDAGLLVLRMGPVTRRVRLAQVSAVAVDGAKVTIGKSDGKAISVYAWRRSRLDRWLGVPVVAGDMAHAISRAAAAQEAPAAAAAARPRRRGDLALAGVCLAGLAEIAAAFGVRLSWSSPLMTAIGVIVALGLGFAGVFLVVSALWMYLGRRRVLRLSLSPGGRGGRRDSAEIACGLSPAA